MNFLSEYEALKKLYSEEIEKGLVVHTSESITIDNLQGVFSLISHNSNKNIGIK